jgi:hypothetical protein
MTISAGAPESVNWARAQTRPLGPTIDGLLMELSLNQK